LCRLTTWKFDRWDSPPGRFCEPKGTEFKWMRISQLRNPWHPFSFLFFCSNLLGQIVGRIAGITVDLKVQPLGEGKWLLATGIRPGDRVQ